MSTLNGTLVTLNNNVTHANGVYVAEAGAVLAIDSKLAGGKFLLNNGQGVLFAASLEDFEFSGATAKHVSYNGVTVPAAAVAVAVPAVDATATA